MLDSLGDSYRPMKMLPTDNITTYLRTRGFCHVEGGLGFSSWSHITAAIGAVQDSFDSRDSRCHGLD
jgi:hypothetical protein